ncbi:helix-turn-helix transcriptional regulator [Pseudomonas aeruginosa]|uniref:PAS domain-containing protein n=1 Tax=Pseudomonas aeruginosa TaxID=287 RepID=UPI00098C88F2|nr:PAS domain-containing protein [Pseudomonas aeruginosa]OOH49639.1 helix-turn-helix transcriptional regulator [Pseudomonas aeruginosa]
MNDQVLRTQTDRRQLQQIIAGLTEGVILIEPDQRILWANEAALAMHGVDSLEGLGADTGEYRERFRLRYRNNHPLQEGQYPAERLVAGECFSDVVVEVFPAADEDTRWVHRVRGLVLTTPEDKPDCLVLILHDATEWASAEQRFEKTFNANPAPAVICRLSDYRYVKVNVGFLEMTGYARDQVIGRSVYELDVLDQAERRELAVERLGAGETIPQMEASLVLYGDDLQALDINQAFSETFGYQAEELLGESTVACGLWQDGGAERLGELLAQSGSVRNVQLRLQHKDRNGLDYLVSAEAVSLNEQDCVLVALLDISDRRRTEMELVHAIETVMQDASWFSRTLIEKLANVRRANAPGTGAELADLTAREREVFDLICQGLADKEIAKELGLAPNTVRNHVATIYAKLDVHSRGEAIVWARERGFAPEPRNGNGRK